MSVSTSSYKYITATSLVYNSATQLYTVSLTAGSDAASLTLYDWTDATGGAIISVVKAAANTTESIEYEKPLFIRTALYAVLTGTSPSASLALDGNFTTTSTSTSTTTTSTSTTTTSTSTTTS